MRHRKGNAVVTFADRHSVRAGHGAGKPTAKIIEDQTDQWSFLVKNLQMKIPF
jgi:prolyl oligopeptidase